MGQLSETLEEFKAAADAIRWMNFCDSKIDGDGACITLEIDTTIFSKGTDGLPVNTREYITVLLGSDFPWSLPAAFVKHWRWVGFPHVLSGRFLCLYLDPSSQWDPADGAAGYLARLSDWFSEAIAGEFDPKTALFHPVGGVPHRTPGAPTIVVEGQLPFEGQGLHWQRILLRERTPHRVDAVAWNRKKLSSETRIGLLVVLPDMLPIGAGCRLSDLTGIVGLQQSNGARKRLLRKLRQTSSGLRPGDPLQIIIAVPNPANDGQGRFHLIACHIDTDQIDSCIAGATKRRLQDSPSTEEPEVVWLYVDDQRPGVNIRRDSEKPVQHLRGRSVDLWGCGGIGSWMAELLVRAGISRITLRDPGHVTQGLLIRQNFCELDVGRPKVEALADRLRSINSKLEIRPVVGIGQRAITEGLDSDLVIDASVSTSVATAIEDAQMGGDLQVPLVQIATDNETATLGIVTICHPQSNLTTNDIDQAALEKAVAKPGLVPFLTFWDQQSAPPLTPTLGCSVPTFRGSGADLVAIASTGLNLASHALSRSLSGGYLYSSPHSPFRVPSRTDVTMNPTTVDSGEIANG